MAAIISAIAGLGIGGGLATAGILGAGASVFGGLMQSNAANKGIAAEQQMFGQAQGALSPYYNAGASALPQLQALLGAGGPGSPGATDALSNTPGFQWLNKMTQMGVSNQGTTTGLGGNTLLAGANAGNQLALSSAWQPTVNALQGLVGMGSGAAGSLAGAATQTGGQIAGSQMNVGNAQAGGITGAAGQFGNALTTNALIKSGLLGNSSMYGIGQQGLINSGQQPGISNGGYNFLDNMA
jgi:hypothetical protein